MSSNICRIDRLEVVNTYLDSFKEGNKINEYLLPDDPQKNLLKLMMIQNSKKYKPPYTRVNSSFITIRLKRYPFGINKLSTAIICEKIPMTPGSFGNLFWLL